MVSLTLSGLFSKQFEIVESALYALGRDVRGCCSATGKNAG